MFNFFTSNKKIGGYIKYFSLEDFWLNNFDDEKRKYIASTFQPMGVNTQKPLVQGRIVESSRTASGLLSNLAGWFDNPRDRSIAIRLVRKSIELAKEVEESPSVDLHFALSSAITILYKLRDDEKVFQEIIDMCDYQISIAEKIIPSLRKELYLTKKGPLPSHKGYTQLAIILKKQKKYQEVINVCAQAKKQGWSGEWDKRIEFAKKQLSISN